MGGGRDGASRGGARLVGLGLVVDVVGLSACEDSLRAGGVSLRINGAGLVVARKASLVELVVLGVKDNLVKALLWRHFLALAL